MLGDYLGFISILLFFQAGPLLAQVQSPAPPTSDRSYHLDQAPVTEAELRQRFTSGQLALLEKLNRSDVVHLARLPELVVPGEWLDDELYYSPLPLGSAWASGHSKTLIIHQPSQVFGAYELGRLVLWGPISSGRKIYPTPSGLFHLNWRSPGRSSTIDPDWYMPWYFNFDNDRGLAFHQLELPGRPASHACVRLLERDARWLYEWGEGWVLDERGWNVLVPGTPVLILGQYDFEAPPPWRLLEWLSTGVELPEEVPTSPTTKGGPETSDDRGRGGCAANPDLFCFLERFTEPQRKAAHGAGVPA